MKRLAALGSMEGVRFLVAGTVNTGVSYLIYAALLYVGLGYKTANFGALVVFGDTSARAFWRYLVGWALIYGGTISVIGGFVSLGFNAYAAGFLALPFSTAMSYLLQKHFVFHGRRA
jgi:putative flippase GtrA